MYHYFRMWRKDGTSERLDTFLREAVREKAGRNRQACAAILGSQSVKTVVGGSERGYDAGKQGTGRKPNLVVDNLGRVLAVVVTAADVQDVAGARLVLAKLAVYFPIAAASTARPIPRAAAVSPFSSSTTTTT